MGKTPSSLVYVAKSGVIFPMGSKVASQQLIIITYLLSSQVCKLKEL
jgi:hypothetical protein